MKMTFFSSKKMCESSVKVLKTLNTASGLKF